MSKKGNYYIGSIIVHGYILPALSLLVVALLLGGVYWVFYGLKSEKDLIYAGYQANKVESEQLVGALKPNTSKIDYISDLVSGDQISKFK